MGIKVLSLFDGISCGMIALSRAGVTVDKYYASEIDKHATKISEANYPDIIRLGDVSQWHKWDIDWSSIDLIIAGSPCQGFSVAGKQLNFRDSRSSLFFEFVDLLHVIQEDNPEVKFLLENVNMKQEYLDTISDVLNIDPIKINSSLVSAQNRNRWYWTNIKDVNQPEDKGILLKDIVLDVQYPNKLHLSEKALNYMNRTVKGGRNHWDFKHHSEIIKDKSSAVVANFYKGVPYNVFIGYDGPRAFDVIECERLQTLPDNYTNHVSKTQRLKSIGNGWTVDVIAHIFSHI